MTPTEQADRDRLKGPIRQSGWAPVFIAWRLFRSIGVTNLAIAAFWIFGGRVPSFVLTIAPLVLVGIAALAILGWWRRTFSVVGDELTVVHGILQREQMTVPLNRVQSVSIDQHLLHRPIGLVKVRVDTAGSPLAEFVVDALDRPTADALRRVVLSAREAAKPIATDGDQATEPTDWTADNPDAPNQQVLVRRTVPELIKVGITQNPFAAIVLLGPALFIISQITDTLDIGPSDLNVFNLPSGPALVGLLIFAGVCALAILVMLWVGSAVTAHHNLTLRRSENGLESKGGLINQRERAASFERIQTVVVRQNPLQRRVGISTLALPTVGGNAIAQSASAGGFGPSKSGGESIVVPGLTASEFHQIVPLVLTADQHRPLILDRPISELAATRWFRYLGLVPAALAVAVLAFVVGWWSLLALVWLAPVWFLSRATQQRWRWGADGETLAVSHGLFTCVDRYVSWRKIQEIDVTQSWFHRRNDLATISISTAADEVKIPHLPVELAHALRDVALARVETDRRPFM